MKESVLGFSGTLKDSDVIAVSVSLETKTGRSLREKGLRISKSNRAYFVSEAQKFRDARRELQKEGFRIMSEGRCSMAIRGQKRLVEKFFGGKIEVRTGTFGAAGKKTKLQLPYADLKVPKHLSGIIDGVVLEPYPIFFCSPTPPDADYYHLVPPNDLVRLLGATCHHRDGMKGAGTKICMIDDGFYEHPYYNGKGYDITLVPVGEDTMPLGLGHATGIASNALAIAPETEFVLINVWDSERVWDPDSAFRAARDERPDVITCSWGLGWAHPDLEDEIVGAVEDDGIVVIFACGNEGIIGYPGCMEEVISAGGVYPIEGGGLEASTYASSGQSGWRPGRQVPDVCGLVGHDSNLKGRLIMMPTVPGGDYDQGFAGIDGTATDDGWLCASGTSSAAPQIAGIAALMLECNPMLTPAEVKRVLEETATDVTTGSSYNGEAAGVGVDLATGHGLVNAWTALARVGCHCTFCAFRRETGCGTKWEVLCSGGRIVICGGKLEPVGCELKREPICPYRREPICDLKFEPVCSSNLEPHPCLKLEPGGCDPSMIILCGSRIVDPGGCGPVSLIAEWQDWREWIELDPVQVTPMARERIIRMMNLPIRREHTRTLSARMATRRMAEPGIRTRRAGRKKLRK